jgi:hypothetical protein
VISPHVATKAAMVVNATVATVPAVESAYATTCICVYL